MKFIVPLIPVSANHYKVPVWNKRRFYVTVEAKAYKAAVAIYARGQQCHAEELEATIVVYLGKRQKLDAGNAEKVVLDGLQDCGAIKNDSRIKRLVVEIHRDWNNPRTEITVEELEARV